MRGALGLIAMGVGYLVFLKATKEQGSLRLTGRILGSVIIIVSILSVLCAATCKMGSCPMSGKAAMCPFTVKDTK